MPWRMKNNPFTNYPLIHSSYKTLKRSPICNTHLHSSCAPRISHDPKYLARAAAAAAPAALEVKRSTAAQPSPISFAQSIPIPQRPDETKGSRAWSIFKPAHRSSHQVYPRDLCCMSIYCCRNELCIPILPDTTIIFARVLSYSRREHLLWREA